MLPNNPTRKPICAQCRRPLVMHCGSEEHLSMIARERLLIAHQNGGEFAPAKKSPIGFGLLLAIGDLCFSCAESRFHSRGSHEKTTH